MDKIIPIDVLQKDIAIYQQILVNEDYAKSLKLVDEITRFLGIDSEIIYYQYQIVLRQLESYSYYEATIFRRLENAEYQQIVEKLCEPKQYDNVIKFPKKKLFLYP